MALLRISDAKKMDKKARDAKIKELRLELARASINSNKTVAKTKEIKKALARLLTLTNAERKQQVKTN